MASVSLPPPILSPLLRHFWKKKGLGIGAVLLPYRLSVTGVGAGPGMFDVSAFLGKEEVLSRMKTNLPILSNLIHEA